MGLTPTEQMHYEAIDVCVTYEYNPDAQEDQIKGISEASRACAKITEQEKLKFVKSEIESLFGEIEEHLTAKGIYAVETKLELLQQQLNERGPS